MIDYTDWQSIYDYYYERSIADGDGEEYAYAYAKGQADLQWIRG